MSKDENINLLEIAAWHIDYWAGEGIGKLLEQDIENNDLESLDADIRLYLN